MIFLLERAQKIAQELQELIYPEQIPVPEYRVTKSRERYRDIQNLDTSTWSPCRQQELWGGDREYFWFELLTEVPGDWAGKAVVLEISTGREGEWDAVNPQFSAYVDGVLRQGLDVNHREVVLTECAKAGETFRVIMSAFTGDANLHLKMDAKLKVLDREVQKFYFDISVPLEIAGLLEEDYEYNQILSAVNEAVNCLDMRNISSAEFRISLKAAQEYIKKELYGKYSASLPAEVYCVGHTHIDVAWLWTLAVTKDKAVRSFSTVLELMRQYPEYLFMSSQPQLYQYVKENAPEIYSQIKERVKEGRWEVEGGMFVEADCNLASGESLVRQFLYGKRFFRQEFGRDNEILWLPDVFGYSAALPQIMKKSGIRYFMTTKISWNEFNQMPYDTFLWEGIDGTEVLTHFITARDYKKAENGSKGFETTYNGQLTASQIMGGWQRYTGKHLNQELLMAYGFGDGGGGPTAQMLERQRRMERGICGCPRTRPATAGEFFHKLEQKTAGNKYLPRWVGELYLEYHRGTYTSMARNKKYNRTSEFAWQNLELFSCLNQTLNQKPYPKEEIKAAWEVILRNQFHDILPGSSIKEVYEDSKKEYEECLEQNKTLTAEALKGLAMQIAGKGKHLVVYNPDSFALKSAVNFTYPKEQGVPVIFDEGIPLPVQRIGEESWLLQTGLVPAKGYTNYELCASKKVSQKEIGEQQSQFKVTKSTMENQFFCLQINHKGQFSSIYDKKQGRELLKPGQCGNVMMTYEDKPHNYDAWDVNHYYVEKSWEVDQVSRMEVLETGPVRACLKITWDYLASQIEQYIYLYHAIPRIDIRHEIEWKEKQIFLRELYPVDIHAQEAVYEIQYGNVLRPTHKNTSWDAAKFEVCTHKWLDFSENAYGISVLNDCKYGCDVHQGVIGISLLKSAIHPNPDADREHHSFVISLFPHKGDFRQAGTIQQAYALNNPSQAVTAENGNACLPPSYSFVSSNQENVIIEAVKQAEDSKDIIVRVYECYNRRTKAELVFGTAIRGASECSLMEEEDTPAEYTQNRIIFEILPYEIKTFKIQLP